MAARIGGVRVDHKVERVVCEGVDAQTLASLAARMYNIARGYVTQGDFSYFVLSEEEQDLLRRITDLA